MFLQLGTVDEDSLEEYYSKSVSLNKQQCQVLLRLTLRRTGCFRARISYKDQPLSNGEFDIIVLNGEQPFCAEEKQCSRRQLAQECSNLLKTDRFIFFPGACVFSCVTLVFLLLFSENEKACVEKNVSTPGISIYFEAYLYSSGNYSSSSWQLPASSLLAPQRRPSMGEEEDEHDSPVEGQPEKVKKPKKVYCYISPKVNRQHTEVWFIILYLRK